MNEIIIWTIFQLILCLFNSYICYRVIRKNSENVIETADKYFSRSSNLLSHWCKIVEEKTDDRISYLGSHIDSFREALALRDKEFESLINRLTILEQEIEELKKKENNDK